ncbi:uncharacterized protein [Diabrotica undecimpunctata]|uniref:uncharacterized protein n=1 Tax=Diabrotica undecimpunctata TaxID=50387 RepID=UPI003B6347E2
MKLLKFSAVVAFVVFVKASDLDDARKILDCAQKALTIGVPELDLPSYNPLHYDKDIRYFNDLTNELSFLYHNTTIYGIPDWQVKEVKQISQDSDAFAVFNFSLTFPQFNATSDFELNSTVFFFQTEFTGTQTLKLFTNEWTGSINVTKPNQDTAEQINDLQISWHAQRLLPLIHAKPTGYDDLFASVFNYTIMTDLSKPNTFVGDFLQEKLNTDWWLNGKIWKLVQWCQDNEYI